MSRVTLDFRDVPTRTPETGPIDFIPPSDEELRRIRFGIERNVRGASPSIARHLADLAVEERHAGQEPAEQPPAGARTS
ncbi:hypothetical protein CO641_02215 [Lysobacteraceae bacterium NML91-0213]|nr:hypothetical protein CO641_02215 [Xanthomonadaceae bacterium NML91-0213]